MEINVFELTGEITFGLVCKIFGCRVKGFAAHEDGLGFQLFCLKRKAANMEMVKLVADILAFFKPASDHVSVDFSSFALLWLDILTPRLKEYQARCKRRRYLSLEDLPKLRKNHFFSKQQLLYILEHMPLAEPIDLQIAACIIGIKQTE